MEEESKILGKKILLITAHPDDESYCCAGTIFKNHQVGGETYLACGTMGERGTSRMKEKPPPEKVGDVRRKELARACAFLEINKYYLFDFPDGELERHKAEYLEKLASAALELAPEVILGFGPDGMTGHLDHIAAYEAGILLARELHLPYYAFCASPELAAEAEEKLRKRRAFGRYANKIIYQKPPVRIDIDKDIKLKAIMTHRSQFGDDPLLGYGEEFFKAEYFCAMI